MAIRSDGRELGPYDGEYKKGRQHTDVNARAQVTGKSGRVELSMLADFPASFDAEIQSELTVAEAEQLLDQLEDAVEKAKRR